MKMTYEFKTLSLALREISTAKPIAFNILILYR
jgi:hypothetical protein